MSSSERTPRAEASLIQHPKNPVRLTGADRFSTEQSTQLREALAAQPEVRPEVVERGRALAADPNWPTHAVMAKIGEIIAGSPDPTDDQS